MKTSKIFDSKIENLGRFAEDLSNDIIKNEPMFFNCSLDFALTFGGPITQSFIENLPNDWKTESTVFDSRVHMLMPGWYPAIPGWHHDDVPRPSIPTGQHFITAGQPNYDNPSYKSEHILGLVNASVCPTEFAIGRQEFSKVNDGDLIYRKWNDEVNAYISDNKMELVKAEDRTLIHFDCDTFHQGNVAVSNGWRWFGRISKNTDRTKAITNEIRKQVQVYLEFPMEGW